MKKIIKKSEDGKELEIHLSIPLRKERCNPYEDDDKQDEMDTVVGVIDRKMSEYGFGYWIDMQYSGKCDQFSSPFYIYDGSREEFIELCKELGISTVEFND